MHLAHWYLCKYLNIQCNHHGKQRGWFIACTGIGTSWFLTNYWCYSNYLYWLKTYAVFYQTCYQRLIVKSENSLFCNIPSWWLMITLCIIYSFIMFIYIFFLWLILHCCFRLHVWSLNPGLLYQGELCKMYLLVSW